MGLQARGLERFRGEVTRFLSGWLCVSFLQKTHHGFVMRFAIQIGHDRTSEFVVPFFIFFFGLALAVCHS